MSISESDFNQKERKKESFSKGFTTIKVDVVLQEYKKMTSVLLVISCNNVAPTYFLSIFFHLSFFSNVLCRP